MVEGRGAPPCSLMTRNLQPIILLYSRHSTLLLIGLGGGVLGVFRIGVGVFMWTSCVGRGLLEVF